MSVSAHLSPEPERRLWLILDSLRQAVDAADRRGAQLVVFAAAAAAWLANAGPRDLAGRGALPLLCAAVMIGLVACAPAWGLPRRLWPLDPPRRRISADDSLIAVDDLVKYSHGELIFKLDKYLGGGITATPYYEDLVGQIALTAAAAARKQRLLRAAWAVLAAGAVLLAVRLMSA